MKNTNLKSERDQINQEIQDLERKIYNLEAKKRQIDYDLAMEDKRVTQNA